MYTSYNDIFLIVLCGLLLAVNYVVIIQRDISTYDGDNTTL
jgi:hypothetical protein